MCNHLFFESNYGTAVCHRCGLESSFGLNPAVGYTDNVPLEHGYSRNHRMATLLKQLFCPQYYGCANSEVVAHALKHGPFVDGQALLNWLMKLRIKQKNYQNCHYYYAISNADYVIPPAPNVEKIRAIEQTFHTMQDRFMEWTHAYKSFFSYNWLLRTLLVQENLPFYLQFVKKIKCKKRVLVYEKMWDFFKNAGSVLEVGGASPGIRRPLDALQGSVSKHHRASLTTLDQLVKIHHCSLVFEA